MSAALLVQARKCRDAIARMTAVPGGIQTAYAELDRLEAMTGQEPLSTGRNPYLPKALGGGQAPGSGRPAPLIFTEARAA